MQQDDIRFSIHGRAGLVLIDRPKALNALSYDMAVALRAQLGLWGEDDTVSHVVMAGVLYVQQYTNHCKKIQKSFRFRRLV